MTTRLGGGSSARALSLAEELGAQLGRLR